MYIHAFYKCAKVGIYCRLTVFFSLFILTMAVQKPNAIYSYICVILFYAKIGVYTIWMLSSHNE